MHSHNCLLYSFLVIFVIGYTVGSLITTTTPTPTPFITYTCSGGKVKDVDMSILDTEAKHISVLKKDGGYCQLKPRNKTGIITCINAFHENKNVKDKIKVVTILYEDETKDGIVGGIHSKYYTLSCVEKVGVVTVVMSPITFRTVLPTSPDVLHAELRQTPTLTVLNPQSPKYVGDKLTLHMTVNSEYKLLPLSCTAYHTNQHLESYKFWDKCHLTDASIIPTNKWKSISTQSTLEIDMYAFRFIDAETLLIRCETTVCPITDTTSCENICSGDRKRRGANIMNYPQRNTNSKNATVSIALKILDRKFEENSSQVLSPVWYIYGIGFGMINLITLLKL